MLGTWFQLCKANKSCALGEWVQNACASLESPAVTEFSRSTL